MNYLVTQDTDNQKLEKEGTQKPGKSSNSPNEISMDTKIHSRETECIDEREIHMNHNQNGKENKAVCNYNRDITGTYISNEGIGEIEEDFMMDKKSNLGSDSKCLNIVNDVQNSFKEDNDGESCCQIDEDENYLCPGNGEGNLKSKKDTQGTVSTLDGESTTYIDEQEKDFVTARNSNDNLEINGTDDNCGPPLIDESSNMTSSSLNSVITQSMVNEEEKYELEDKAEAEKSREQVSI